jgi:predicted ArsR family transcriptional regulator
MPVSLSGVSELAETKRRIVDRLKRVESATAASLAEEFGLTDTAIRQHLDALEVGGLVQRHHGAPEGRGRPPVHWRLTALAEKLFPDRHADLTVDLIGSIRDALGEEALSKVIASRADRQLSAYRAALPPTDVAVRVRTLAALRTAEGYLAEVTTDPDDERALVLTEHHCPIHDAATACLGLCGAELSLFQQALGDDVVVTRSQHLLSGDARCSYRISPAV